MASNAAGRTFTYSELAAATGGFNPLSIIGEGGFGKVYRAMLHYTPVAIKVRARRVARVFQRMGTEGAGGARRQQRPRMVRRRRPCAGDGL